MESKTHNHHEQLHIFFFPYMAQGHLIPMLEMAKLFASRGLKSTLITTTSIAPFFSKTLISETSHIDIVTFEFPCLENGFLPIETISKLGPQLDHLLQQHRPHCLVADVFFPWATDVAAKYGIPRIVFHGSCFFSISAFLSIYLYAPHKNVSSDSEPFVITNLPGDIQITRDQMPDFQKNDDHEDNEKPFTKFYRVGMEAEMNSYGVLVNSFYELEKDYADYYRKGLGMKAWSIGCSALGFAYSSFIITSELVYKLLR
ncbi:hypothetical protein FEM48_Zijuj10G0041600 [Ziziphus jujuba var. spinosa]|uniref:Scopoletin glucosyltransferase-like n=1 Tax=Ziziphus jujuba var. spinosa TaxID=714518 RepID=A0A978UL77_ZIZJJ|nr:hypothetical protein FEM48_Zijuj10G0041600 [Ziziphus jujuba var. spinosa]